MLGRSPGVARHGDRRSCLSMVVLLSGSRLCGNTGFLASPPSCSECLSRPGTYCRQPGSVDVRARGRGYQVLITADGRATCGEPRCSWPDAYSHAAMACSRLPVPWAYLPGTFGAINCAAIAATMQMPVLRVGLSLMYATDRRRPPLTATDRDGRRM